MENSSGRISVKYGVLKYERPKDDLAAGPQPAIVSRVVVGGGGGAVSQPLYAQVASPGHKSLDIGQREGEHLEKLAQVNLIVVLPQKSDC